MYADGKYFIAAPVAKVGETMYLTFDDAYKAAIRSREAIELFQTVVLEGVFAGVSYANVTVKANFGDVAFRIQGSGKVTFDNVNVESDDYCFIIGEKEGEKKPTLVINGGEYKGATTVASVTKGKLEITDGTFEVEPYQGNYNYTINCVDANYKNGDATVAISGGKFYNYNPANNAAEGAGTNFVAEGYAAAKDAQHWYTVGKIVAEVNGVGHSTLQAAIDAVAEGETATVKVVENHEITTCTVLNWDDTYPMLVLVGNKKITLDLNGKTIEVKKDFGMGISSVFYVYGDDAEFNFVDSSEEGTGAIHAYAYSHSCWLNRMFWSGTGATMNFYSGTYTLQKNPNDSNARFGWMLYNNIGDTNIYGGTFIMADNNYDMLGCQGSGVIPTHKHVIYGGKFNRNDAKITRNVNIAEGHVCQQNGDMWEVFYAVAQVGDKYYASLAEAVEAAPAEGTVTVVNNATGAGVVINKSLTIDFNGKTYTFDGGVGSNGTETLGLQIKKDNNVTLKNGTLTSTGDKVKMLIQNYANLDVVDMNLNDETDYIQYVLSNNYGKTQILGNTNITTDAVAFDSYDYTKYYPAPAVVIVKTKGTIEGAIEKSEKATIEIYSGTYTMDVNDWCATGYATVDNHNDTWTVESLYVADMVIDYNAYGVDEDFENQNVKTVGKLTYKRKFKESVLNKWQTLYVPFEVPVEELVASEDYEIAYLNGVHAYDRNEDSVIDSLSVEYIKIKSGTLYANTPYMIKPKKSEALELELVLNDVTLYTTDDASQNKIECASAFVEFQFGGTYEFQYGNEILDKLYGNRLLPSASPMLYYAGGGEWWNGHGEYDTMKFYAFDLYFALKAKANSPYKVDIKSESVGSRVIGEENEDGTTTIYDVPEEMDVNGMIFDLSGRRVNETEKGIYIQNGKKVLVK